MVLGILYWVSGWVLCVVEDAVGFGRFLYDFYGFLLGIGEFWLGLLGCGGTVRFLW